MRKFHVVLLADYSHELYVHKLMGPHKIASALRQAGYDTLVINHLHAMPVPEILKILSQVVSDQTLFVGVNPFFYKNPSDSVWVDHIDGNRLPAFSSKDPGSMIPQGRRFNIEIKNLVRNINPGCKFVLGGPDAQDSAFISDFDYTILGYADLAIINLAHHLARNDPLKYSRRSIYGSTIIDDSRADGYDFAGTPMLYHPDDIIVPGETLSIEISRGCIFQCAFCNYPLNGKKKRDYVKLEEILLHEFLHNYQHFGTTRYLFSDDTFNDSTDKIDMMHRIAKKLPFQLEYWAFIRLDLLAAHPESIQPLFDSGCRACFFGIETLDSAAGSIIGKGGDRQRLIDCLHFIKSQYGSLVNLYGSFIFGLPKESKQSMIHTGETLLQGQIPLDGWNIVALKIYGDTVKFRSKIDSDYAKYGYQLRGLRREYDKSTGSRGAGSGGFYDWVSPITDYDECVDLAGSIMRQYHASTQHRLPGIESFYIASTGFDLSSSLNHQVRELDWPELLNAKQTYVKNYHSLLCRHLYNDVF